MGPVTSNVYNLSTTQLKLLQLTIVLPIIAIWFIATYGASRFKRYALTIQKDPDGKAFNKLANALLVLVYLGLILPTALRAFLPYMVERGLRIPFTIFSNITSILLPLIAFLLIYLACRQLKGLAKAKANPRMALGVVGALAALYAYELSQNPYRNSSPDPTKYASFFLPDPLVILIVILPYVVLWVLGTLAIADIKAYQRGVKGVIYKQALKNLALGLQAVIFFSILLQLFTAVGRYFSRLGLGPILLLVYLIIILWGIGYVMIARGAKNLTKIEELK